LLLGQMEFVDQALEGMGLLDWIEVFTLKIFDQRHFECQFFGDVAQNHWHGVHASALGGTPPSFASD